MKYLIGVCLTLCLTTSHLAWAEEVRVSCSQIADATERLACFDRTFPSASTTDAPQSKPVDAIESRTVIPDSPAQPRAATTEVVEAPALPAPPAQVDTEGLSKGGMFAAKPKTAISSKLKSVRDADKQKMIFLLENDQIWLQDSPRSLPFSKGQDVTIKSGTIGGYLLSNEEGVSTRVRRIK